MILVFYRRIKYFNVKMSARTHRTRLLIVAWHHPSLAIGPKMLIYLLLTQMLTGFMKLKALAPQILLCRISLLNRLIVILSVHLKGN